MPNITGIQKLDEQTVSVTLNGFSASAVYAVLGVTVAPLHYYGDTALYDERSNRFGFPLGDVSVIQAKTTRPLGAGPYKFIKYENGSIYLEANTYYWKGEPSIKYIQLKKTPDADMISGVLNGTMDVADPAFTPDAIAAIRDANGGVLSGDKLYTSTVNDLAYGYIGITATNVCVGGQADSEASKHLRRGLLTALALYRDVEIDSYYGETASVINYPIVGTYWAAPQNTDADDGAAFCTDMDGNIIYTADMSMAEKEQAALAAITGYLRAAGYTYNEADGWFTAAPEGAMMEYEAIINGGGTGEHPAFGILMKAKALLAKIGITLTISDIPDNSDLLGRVQGGYAQLFCMEREAAVGRELCQAYDSGNVPGAGGTDDNLYWIMDPELDALIMDARGSQDPPYRQSVCEAALDTVINWAVELPVYQRRDACIFSTERVNVDTLPGDMTPYWSFLEGIENAGTERVTRVVCSGAPALLPAFGGLRTFVCASSRELFS